MVQILLKHSNLLGAYFLKLSLSVGHEERVQNPHEGLTDIVVHRCYNFLQEQSQLSNDRLFKNVNQLLKPLDNFLVSSEVVWKLLNPTLEKNFGS